MKTISSHKLIRLVATNNSRLVAGFAAIALMLLASCTTSRPVFYAGPGSVETIAALPGQAVAAQVDGDVEVEVQGGHGVRAQMQCWRCDGVSWIRHNADQHTDHTCPFCSTVNTL